MSRRNGSRGLLLNTVVSVTAVTVLNKGNLSWTSILRRCRARLFCQTVSKAKQKQLSTYCEGILEKIKCSKNVSCSAS